MIVDDSDPKDDDDNCDVVSLATTSGGKTDGPEDLDSDEEDDPYFDNEEDDDGLSTDFLTMYKDAQRSQRPPSAMKSGKERPLRVEGVKFGFIEDYVYNEAVFVSRAFPPKRLELVLPESCRRLPWTPERASL